jgi:hypothetical protein
VEQAINPQKSASLLNHHPFLFIYLLLSKAEQGD